MTRSQILKTALLILLVTILGIVILVLGVFCLPVILVKPSITNRPQEFIMGRVTRTITQMMFRSSGPGPVRKVA